MVEKVSADIQTMAGRIFTMAIGWNEGQKTWDEELIIRLFTLAAQEARDTERKYWQEFMRLNHFEDHSESFTAGAEARTKQLLAIIPTRPEFNMLATITYLDLERAIKALPLPDGGK